MLNKIFQFNKGFTLLETVVAVFVLIVGAVGVFTVVQNIAFSSQINASKLTATYLAQEGIELVRNQRDSNWLTRVDWKQGLPEEDEAPMPLPFGKFKRTITSVSEGDDKIIVAVVVNWQEKGKNYSVAAQTELYNWYER